MRVSARATIAAARVESSTENCGAAMSQNTPACSADARTMANAGNHVLSAERAAQQRELARPDGGRERSPRTESAAARDGSPSPQIAGDLPTSYWQLFGQRGLTVRRRPR